MKKINVLSKDLSQLIAAGEVVEKPASVVKELLENSIDSGATRITVEIANGGVKMIKISDNGSGIYRDDVKNAFLRHATSKLSSKDDLEHINSLGFRGEALASICAVSRVEVITKSEDEEIGTKFYINAGIPGKIDNIGCTVGTVIIVRDLFYNVPARMKFLKKDITEANACAVVVDKLALSHPEISFKFIRDGKEVLHTSGDGKISSAVYGVYGREFFEGMMEVEYKYKNVEISGLVSKPSYSKASRSMQNVFINGRYVKSQVITGAIEEAFKNSIMVGKFPCCAIYVKVPTSSVDVNVHPTKTEVKFSNEKLIFEAVYYAIKTAIMNFNNRNSIFSDATIENKKEPENKNFDFKFFDSNSVLGKGTSKNNNFNFKKESEPVLPRKVESSEIKNNFIKNEVRESPIKEYKKTFEVNEVPKSVEVKQETKSTEKSPERFVEKTTKIECKNENSEIVLQTSMVQQKEKMEFVGEIFDCYILIQKGNDLILVDKHAAHERLIFEKLKKGITDFDSQNLIEPIVVNLEKDEYSAILSSLDLLNDVGYAVEDFGTGSILVRGTPMYMDTGDINSSITEIATYLMNNKNDISTKKLDWLYENIACRSAIKAGQKNNKQELLEIVKQLEENPGIQNCPHGRPIFTKIDKKFIEKKFGRV